MSWCKRDAPATELTGRNGREGGTCTRDLLYPKQVALLLGDSPWSGRSDLNRRSPASKTGALAGLSYAQGPRDGIRTHASQLRRPSADPLAHGQRNSPSGAHEGDRTLLQPVDSRWHSPECDVRNW